MIATDPLVDTDGGDPNRWPGLVASLLLLAAGYALLALAKHGPLATAGVVASALAVPPLLFFATFTESDFPPFNVDVILGLSAVVWLASYLVGPGKGHALYLGAGLFAAWLFVLEAVEGVFSAPFDLISAFAFGFNPGFDPGSSAEVDPFGADPFSEGPINPSDPFNSSDLPGLPDPATLGGICLVLAAAYLVTAAILDRRGRSGMATPFTVAGIVIAPVGLLFLTESFGNLGSGVAFTLLGIAFAAGGAMATRRWTTWFGGVLVVQGLAVIGSELVGDDASATTVGLVLMALGLVAVAAAWAVGAFLHEPHETEPGPSTFGKRPPGPANPPGDLSLIHI